MRNPIRQHGFTIVELMIAMLLGLFLVAGVITLFLSSRQSFSQDENTARLQDEARYAMQELARDLRMASYITEPLVPGSITPDGSLTLATDCGPGDPDWIYGFMDAGTGEINTLTSLDNTDGATANAGYSCIDADEIVEDTDVVAIKRTAGDPLPEADLEVGTVYVRSNGTTALLYQNPPATVIAGPYNDWEYRPRIYYIRNFSSVEGDGIPSLCRKVLEGGGAPTMTTECIAQGIENLQLEYGLDTDSDGSADRYLPNPTLTEIQDVVSARAFILARTRDEDRSRTDGKTYRISNAPDYAPDDNFHRRVYEITVTVHNLRNLRQLGI
jgi:type IV pilus assembly protein PilW